MSKQREKKIGLIAEIVRYQVATSNFMNDINLGELSKKKLEIILNNLKDEYVKNQKSN